MIKEEYLEVLICKKWNYVLNMVLNQTSLKFEDLGQCKIAQEMKQSADFQSLFLLTEENASLLKFSDSEILLNLMVKFKNQMYGIRS